MVSDTTIRPMACWTGQDRLGSAIVPVLTIIFRTRGCGWNRCRMCGYRHIRAEGMTDAEARDLLLAQLRWVLSRHPPEGFGAVKIFTSGSFLDPREVPPDARDAILSAFRGRMVIAETRPEFVTPGTLGEALRAVDDGSVDRPLVVAIGLETADDRIREKCIDKGFTCADFLRAARAARDAGAGVKAYLLMKPPYLTEEEAAADMLSSIRRVAPVADFISMNPCTVQRGTEVERLWRQGAYRPPYLWSVLRVLLEADRHVTCDPVGGGYTRGPHNCGRCDREILDAIREYSLTADRPLLRAVADRGCSCRAEWEFVREHERPYAMPLTR